MARTPTRFPRHGSECKALLAACHREPDDDTPRLVLADWLEEHDDPRGELMRLQVRLAALPAGDPEYDELFAQHQKWWKNYGRLWAKEVGSKLPDAMWDIGPHDRGLPTIGHYNSQTCLLESFHFQETPLGRLPALVADGWPGMTWVLPSALCEESGWNEADDFVDVFADDEYEPEADDWEDLPVPADPFDTFRQAPWKESPTPIGVWYLGGGAALAEHIDELARLPNLRGLVLARWRATPDLLPRIAKLKSLEHLHLGNMPLNDVGLDALAPLRKTLRTLIAPGASTSNAGAARLAEFTELRELRLGTRRLSAAGFQVLAKLPKLEVLELAKADDKAVGHLAPVQRLRRLDLSGTKATGRGVETFPLLTHLNLDGSSADDDGLASVAQLPRLRLLRLMHTRVTGAGLVHLSGLRWLETLSLSQQKKVGNKDLVHLEGLKNLRDLDLFGTATTMHGVGRLRKKLKYLTIQR